MRVIVTGGAGFIGSALVRRLVRDGADVVNIDRLTYAGNMRNLAEVEGSTRHRFVKADVGDFIAMTNVFREFSPTHIFHLAAESHVDRSIDGPKVFVDTNILGTFTLLDVTRAYVTSGNAMEKFRFIHVSTDEVYGSLGETGLFSEETAYAPNSPYSASKASADMLARAWHRTYGVPVIISNCSNNYGPYQNPEKLIPTVIGNALLDRPIPIYGDGKNLRDWLYVDDHVEALLTIAERGRPGEKYNVGGHNEIQNIEIARTICQALDVRRPRADGKSYAEQITFVKDRPGHDKRYAIDPSKTNREINWRPRETFSSGIARTVEWYCDNEPYWRDAAGAARRLGLKTA